MDIFGANTDTYKWNGCAEFYIASEPSFLRMFDRNWSRCKVKSADILQFSDCRLAFSNAFHCFLSQVLFFVSMFTPAHSFVLSASQPSPLWKRCVRSESSHIPRSIGFLLKLEELGIELGYQHLCSLCLAIPFSPSFLQPDDRLFAPVKKA